MVHSIHRLRSPQNAVYVLDFSTVDSLFIFPHCDRHIFQLLLNINKYKCCTLGGYLFHEADEDSGKCNSSESETGTQIT